MGKLRILTDFRKTESRQDHIDPTVQRGPHTRMCAEGCSGGGPAFSERTQSSRHAERGEVGRRQDGSREGCSGGSRIHPLPVPKEKERGALVRKRRFPVASGVLE